MATTPQDCIDAKYLLYKSRVLFPSPTICSCYSLKQHLNPLRLSEEKKKG